MFLMVYFHHKSVIMEELLKRYMVPEDCPFSITSDLDAYLHLDDAALIQHLRESPNTWAQQVVQRRPWKRVVERHGTPHQAVVADEASRLGAAGIDHIAVRSTGQLSRYAQAGRRRAGSSIYVINSLPGQGRKALPLTEVSSVFGRFADARCLARLYVAPDQVERAQQELGVPPR